MSTTAQQMTADDLLSRPNDGFRYELVKGELRKMARAGHEHGRIAVRFTWRLAQHVETNNLGAVYEEVGKVAGYWPGAPDLAVEVVSPGDTYSEVEEKAIEWLETGALMVLALNPRKHA